MLATGQAGQKRLFLLLRPPLKDRQSVQRQMHRNRLPHGRIAVLQRFGNDAQREKVHPGATVARGQADAQKAQLRHLRQQFVRKTCAYGRARQ